MWWHFLVVIACASGCAGDRYAFFTELHARSEGTGNWTRRVFGGKALPKGSFPAACLLLDHSLHAGCSCSVLAPRWALTAAHCANSGKAYVRFQHKQGYLTTVPIHLLYSHPNYRVVQRDEGEGMDVVVLHNDVGLVRTRRDMAVGAPRLPPGVDPDPLRAMLNYNPALMYGEEIEMLGYGTTERIGAGGTQLHAVRLRVAMCERDREAWKHCGCASGEARGVCAGDSGGPVVFKGVQIGVTSMGPTVCAPEKPEPKALPTKVISVFTAAQPYVEMLNSTIYNLKSAMAMKPITPQPNSAAVKLASNFITLIVLRVML